MVKISRKKCTLLLLFALVTSLLIAGTVSAANITFKAINLDAQALRQAGYTPVALEFGYPVSNKFDIVLGLGFSQYQTSATDPDDPESKESNSESATVWSLGLRYYLPEGRSYRPFLFGNVGIIRLSGVVESYRSIQPQEITLVSAPEDPFSLSPYLQYQFNAGLGAQFAVTEDWSVIAEAGVKALTTKEESDSVVNTSMASTLYSAIGLRFDF